VKHLPSAGLALIATLAALLPRTAVAQATTPTFVQGTAFSTARISAVTAVLAQPVAQGDLLVGWVSQFDASGQVQVSDDVNGAWTRAGGSMTFTNDAGDIALYYRENSQAAPGGVTIAASASSSTYLQGAVAEYSGVALAGSLDQIAFARDVGTAVDAGATAAVDAGELVFASVITGGDPGSVTPGSSLGVPYTPRAQTPNGSSYEEDITSSAAGGQHGTATLAFATDWHAVCAVFHPAPAIPPVPPSAPTDLEASSVASTRVAVSWSPPSIGNVAGYTVYRDGSAIGTTRPDTTTFLDTDVAPSSIYTYAVDAFDLVNDHSAQSASLTVATPAQSPEFVQGASASSSDRISSYTLTLIEPVQAGDLLVGWFGQYNAPGQVQVSDNVNGPWTRSVSTTWNGTGDIALLYLPNSAAAPSGLVITVSASAPAFLQEAVAHYRYVGSLDQALVAQGIGTDASAGPTAPVPAGELVVASVLTGDQPGWASPGSSQTVPYLLDVQNGSAASDLEDILSSAAGPQQGTLTLGASTDWFMVLATFLAPTAATTTTTTTTSTTQGPTTTTTTTAPPPTSTTTTPTTTSTTSTTLPGPGTCDNPTVIPAEGGTFGGTTSGTSAQAGSCGSSGTSPEQVFEWTPAASGTATIETCGTGTTFDSVLYMRSGQCAGGPEVACNDDACANSTGLNRASRITPTVTGGQTYFIVVDGYGGAQGTFSLTVTPP
jgi:hypothetical protein